MKHIVVRSERCTGCRLCQLTCSAQNFRINTHKAGRIGIAPDGADRDRLADDPGVNFALRLGITQIEAAHKTHLQGNCGLLTRSGCPCRG